MEKMFVIDERYGDYLKAGPFDTVRLDSLDDERVTLLCSSGSEERRVRVSYSFGIFLEEVEE